MFRHQTFQVTIDETPRGHDLNVAYDVMVKLGVRTTTAQELSIKTDWRSTIGEFLTYLQDKQYTLKMLNGLTFENFWSAEPWNLPYMHVISHLIEFIEISRETRRNLIIDGVKEEWSVIKTAIQNTNKTPATLLGYKEGKGRAPLHLARSFSIFLTLLKFIVIDEKNLAELMTYFDQTEWERRQGEILSDDLPQFRTVSFIYSFICFPTIMVAEHCTKRCVIERYMLEKARRTKEDEDLAYDIKHTYPRFDKFFPKMKLPTKNEHATDRHLKVTKVFMTTKISTAIRVTLLSDVIKTINEFGFNGTIECIGNANHLLHMYVK